MVSASDRWASAIIIFTLTVCAVISSIIYIIFPSQFISVVNQTPFSDWASIKNIFLSMEGKNRTTDFTSLLLTAAWCNKFDARNRSMDLRSDGCVCLSQVAQRFINTATPYTYYNCSSYADQSLSCMQKRPVWDVESCGDLCNLNPSAMSLSAAVVMLLPVATFAVKDMAQGGVVYSVISGIAMLGILPLLITDFIQNILFITFILVSLIASLVGLRHTKGLMDHVWCAAPLAGAIIIPLVLSMHRLRDAGGLVGAGVVAYLAGFSINRMHWLREHVGRGMFLYTSWLFLFLASSVAWVAILVILYTNWIQSAPVVTPYTTVISLGLIMFSHILEGGLVWGNSFLARDNEFGTRQAIQSGALVASVVIISAYCAADATIKA